MPKIATRSAQPAQAPRQRILAAAVRLFAAKGFEGTTTRLIAQAADLNEALIFRHFPTKRDLYAAIIQNKIEAEATRNLVTAASASDPDDCHVFRQIAASIFETVEEDPEFLRILYFSALEGHELSNIFFESFVQQLQTLICDRVASGTAEKRFRQLDPYLAARAFIGMLGHYLLAQQLFQPAMRPYNKTQVIETFVDIFLHGITKGSREK